MRIAELGIVDYLNALDFQKKTVEDRIAGRTEDTLILCEHRPVVTLGRTSGNKDLLDPAFFQKKGVKVLRTSRGGLITYHSPGQLMAYPVFLLPENSRDVSLFIDLIEKSVVRALRRMGVDARRSGRRGVWVSGKKIAFTGVAFRRWVSYHGVCVNVNNDISAFGKINPCGEPDIEVTSVRAELGRPFDMREARALAAEAFETVFSACYGAKAVC
ncbi:MAG: lipoyl(octanoyl) transferase LipB [Candidatus Omnitrophica bacterium]|nr:lipoyl(octanoyl) transferase LipB [Candidatus Omnitrophota bacterium]